MVLIGYGSSPNDETSKIFAVSGLQVFNVKAERLYVSSSDKNDVEFRFMKIMDSVYLTAVPPTICMYQFCTSLARNIAFSWITDSQKVLKLENAGKECFQDCSKTEGPCSFCGNGSCCKFMKYSQNHECDGSIGGKNTFTCSSYKHPNIVVALKAAQTNCRKNIKYDRKYDEPQVRYFFVIYIVDWSLVFQYCGEYFSMQNRNLCPSKEFMWSPSACMLELLINDWIKNVLKIRLLLRRWSAYPGQQRSSFHLWIL